MKEKEHFLSFRYKGESCKAFKNIDFRTNKLNFNRNL